MPQVAINVGITRLNAWVSTASSAQPPKQLHNVRFSVGDISRYQFIMSPSVAGRTMAAVVVSSVTTARAARRPAAQRRVCGGAARIARRSADAHGSHSRDSMDIVVLWKRSIFIMRRYGNAKPQILSRDCG